MIENVCPLVTIALPSFGMELKHVMITVFIVIPVLLILYSFLFMTVRTIFTGGAE